MVVHVDAFFGRVEVAVFKIEHRALAAGDEAPERAIRNYVNIGEAAAVKVVGAFALIGGGGAAPEEVCGKGHSDSPFLWRWVSVGCAVWMDYVVESLDGLHLL